MPVGELFLGAFLQVLFDRLATGLVLAFARRERIYKLLRRWSERLSLIQAFIDDAEEKQLTESAVKKWLEHLRDLAYDLDDVLDEICTEAQIQKSKGVEERSGKLWKCLPTCKDFTPGAYMFKKKMKSNIEAIAIRLDNIAKDGMDMNLSQKAGGPSNHPRDRLPTTSIVEPHVYGRDEDKKSMSKLMRGNQENVDFIPIVGMGGIGKTTLAQLIYHDEVMGSGFDLKDWVCISEEFDVLTITKAIFHAVSKESAESKNLNMLQESLQATFSKKKFLLVFDDVWNRDYVKWEAFVRPFRVGLPGSKVLVTTRDEGIARMVGSIPSYHVSILSDKDCLSLLAQHALGRDNFDEHPHLEGIAEALAKKCKGLPLAAKTLGGLLRSEGPGPAYWEGVLHSKIWNLPKEHNILPVLRLSYHHLPSHLKHLFAYCSIFPKDYEFDKFELVLLWMGEGFLTRTEGNKTKEQLGFEYFDELLSRSFFQRLSSNSSRFVMHDLINDLAQFVAGGICYKLDEKVETDDEYGIPQNARHASFLRHEYEVFRKFNGFYGVKGLRTFLPMPVQNTDVGPPFYLSTRIVFDLLPKLHSSRVLSLSGYSITKVPDSICKLIHLRYLNLSGTSIDSLPESLKDLYNLETLSIRNCHFICKLLPTIGNLVNLQHLDNSNTDRLKELPVELGKLKSLQSLPKIVLSKDGGLGLGELRHLKLLRGTVALTELQNVSDVKDAKDASMRSKEIVELLFSWARNVAGSRDGQLEHNVLDVLKPHENLRKLEIKFYGGVKLPSWIGDPSFSNIFSVSLSGCIECTSLPPLGLLPELKQLRIGDMPKIKCIGVEFFGKPSVGVPFPKLETLQLDRMPIWEEWSCLPDEVQIQFSFLHKLTIFKCSNLTTVSPMSLPLLRDLDLEECSMVVLDSICDLGSINYLKVASVTGLSHLPTELVQAIKTIEVLECCNCNELISVWPNGVSIEHLSSLRRLVVAECPLFLSLGEEDLQLPCNLEILELFQCASMISLPNDLRNFRCLRELIIKNCPGITSFPGHAIPPMLKRLEIVSCTALESLPSDITNLERLEIKECKSLRNWSAGNFPDGLKKLSIKNCEKLKPVHGEMFPPNGISSLDELTIWDWQNSSTLLQNVHNFSCLTGLYLSHYNGLEYFSDQGLPPTLRTLSVEHCSKLRALPTQIQNMTSIVSLEIRSCRKLKSFPKCDFPPNLSSLRLWDSRKLKPLSQWGLHRLHSLKEFSICGGFPDLQSLANDHSLFPDSLVKFSIARFPKLTSLSRVLEDLISLQHLSIMNCTSLNVLPTENILEKLWHLEISGCPLLKERCLKDRGDYWPKISGIPCVEIDGTYIYSQC